MPMQEEQGEPHADMHCSVPAASVEVAGVRHAVLASAAAHAIPQALRDDIALAVSEACANVVMHAYPGTRPPGPLTVETYEGDREFVVVVSDEGVGFSPRTDSPGLGLGLALISRLSHRLEITDNAPAGARVTMAFGLA
jgi:serine/threonine-protein kinase RsbW